MKVTRNDPTPNPDAIKFVLDGQIVSAGSRSFRDRVLCEDPIAKRLFEVEEVVSVFFVSNVVTVTKDPFGDWSVLIPRINQVLEEATEGFEPASTARATPTSPSLPNMEGAMTDPGFFEKSYDDKVAKINRIFDEAVRPGLASDGGGLLLVEIVDKIVRIQYQGACGSCPSSTAGTLSFIENVLRGRIHPDLEVELV
jgi:NFU1 iron-sulfur cluster scaffold homolog, mitochondrial